MTFEMYNNYFKLVHAVCVIVLAWPWPHALTARWHPGIQASP